MGKTPVAWTPKPKEQERGTKCRVGLSRCRGRPARQLVPRVLSAGKVETVQNLVFNVSYTFKKHNSSGYRKKMKWKQRHTGGRSLFSLLASIDKIGLSNVCDNFQQLPLSFCASPPWSLDSTHPVASCGRPAPGRRARGAGAGALAGSRPAGGVCLWGLRRAGPGPQ